MQRSPLTVVCVLLAVLAAPLGGITGLLTEALGIASCGGPDCCCRAAQQGACCETTGAALHAPRLMKSCRCGSHDDGTAGGAPDLPRLCTAQAARLPEPCAGPRVPELSPSPPSVRRPAPEPPPPRPQD